MKMEITGKRFGTFTNKLGTSIEFRTLYVKVPLKAREGTECDGYISDKIGVTHCLTDDDMRLLEVGDVVDVTFNQYGNTEGVEIC